LVATLAVASRLIWGKEMVQDRIGNASGRFSVAFFDLSMMVSTT